MSSSPAPSPSQRRSTNQFCPLRLLVCLAIPLFLLFLYFPFNMPVRRIQKLKQKRQKSRLFLKKLKIPRIECSQVIESCNRNEPLFSNNQLQLKIIFLKEELAILQELSDSFVIDLRNYQPLGEIFRIGLYLIPPQPKKIRQYVITKSTN